MIAGRRYVVTGASSGIGAATKALLQQRGATVVGVDLAGAEVSADLATADGRRRLVDEVRSLLGPAIDGVVAAAGVNSTGAKSVTVNFFGAVATLEGLRPLLACGDAPRAVAVTSFASTRVRRGNSIVDACLRGDEEAAVAAVETGSGKAYPSSKAALNKWIRREAVSAPWAAAGIVLNAVAPGVVVTPMTQRLIDDEERRRALDAWVPMQLGGHATPEQIGEVLCWLTSSINTHVTAQVIFADGGAEAFLERESKAGDG